MQALEQQLELIGTTRRLGEKFSGPTPTEGTFASLGSDERMQLALAPLFYGDTYYWSPEMCGLLEATAQTIPDWTPQNEDFSSEFGFVWFARPLTLPEVPQEFGADTAACSGLAAITWSWVCEFYDEGPKRLLNALPEQAPLRAGLVLGFYLWAYGRPQYALGTPWYAGEHLSTFRARAKVSQEAFVSWLLGYVAASFALMAQEIVVSPAQLADRAFRKRNPNYAEHTIRVVQLRRAVSSGHRQSSDDPIEWSCQWIVRGHWRAQWFPKSQAHRPIWITPYVKGNPDAPLKAPTRTVFAITR